MLFFTHSLIVHFLFVSFHPDNRISCHITLSVFCNLPFAFLYLWSPLFEEQLIQHSMSQPPSNPNNPNNSSQPETLKDKFSFFIKKETDANVSGSFFNKLFNSKSDYPTQSTGISNNNSNPQHPSSGSIRGSQSHQPTYGSQPHHQIQHGNNIRSQTSNATGSTGVSGHSSGANGNAKSSPRPLHSDLDLVKITLSTTPPSQNTTSTSSQLSSSDDLKHSCTIYASGHPPNVPGTFQWFRIPTSSQGSSSERIIPVSLSERPMYFPTLDDVGYSIGVQWIHSPSLPSSSPPSLSKPSHPSLPPSQSFQPAQTYMPSAMAIVGPVVVDQDILRQSLSMLLDPITQQPVGSSWKVSFDAVVVSVEPSKLSTISSSVVAAKLSKISSTTALSGSSYTSALSRVATSQQQECTLLITHELLSLTLFQDSTPAVVMVHAPLAISALGSRQCVIIDTSTNQYASVRLVSSVVRDRFVLLLQHLSHEQQDNEATDIGTESAASTLSMKTLTTSIMPSSPVTPLDNIYSNSSVQSSSVPSSPNSAISRFSSTSHFSAMSGQPHLSDLSPIPDETTDSTRGTRLSTSSLSTSDLSGSLSTSNHGYIQALRAENARLQQRSTRVLAQQLRLREEFERVSRENELVEARRIELEIQAERNLARAELEKEQIQARLRAAEITAETANARLKQVTSGSLHTSQLLRELEYQLDVAQRKQAIVSSQNAGLSVSGSEVSLRSEITSLQTQLLKMKQVVLDEKRSEEKALREASINYQRVLSLESLLEKARKDLISLSGASTSIHDEDMSLNELFSDSSDDCSTEQDKTQVEHTTAPAVDSIPVSTSSSLTNIVVCGDEIDTSTTSPETTLTKESSLSASTSLPSSPLPASIVEASLRLRIGTLEEALQTSQAALIAAEESARRLLEDTSVSLGLSHQAALTTSLENARQQFAVERNELKEQLTTLQRQVEESNFVTTELRDIRAKTESLSAELVQTQQERDACKRENEALCELNDQWKHRLLSMEIVTKELRTEVSKLKQNETEKKRENEAVLTSIIPEIEAIPIEEERKEKAHDNTISPLQDNQTALLVELNDLRSQLASLRAKMSKNIASEIHGNTEASTDDANSITECAEEIDDEERERQTSPLITALQASLEASYATIQQLREDLALSGAELVIAREQIRRGEITEGEDKEDMTSPQSLMKHEPTSLSTIHSPSRNRNKREHSIQDDFISDEFDGGRATALDEYIDPHNFTEEYNRDNDSADDFNSHQGRSQSQNRSPARLSVRENSLSSSPVHPDASFPSRQQYDKLIADLHFYKRRAQSLSQAVESILRENHVDVNAIQDGSGSSLGQPSTPRANGRFGSVSGPESDSIRDSAGVSGGFGVSHKNFESLPSVDLRPVVDDLTMKLNDLQAEKDNLEDSLKAHERTLESERHKSSMLAESLKLVQNTNNSSWSQLQKQYIDLKHLANVLTDELNDKGVALDHMRRANKMLGGRVGELEKKLAGLASENNISSRQVSDSE